MGDAVNAEQLLGLSLLEGMPDAVKQHICEVFISVSEAIDLDAGEALMQEGYLAFGSGYVLAQGDADVEKGEEKVATVSAPALLGEMSQFKSHDTRSATVRASEEAVALQFDWDEFYEKATSDLSDSDHALLIEAIEKLVWERFGCEAVLDLPLFSALDEGLRFKLCSIFPWITDKESFAAGEEIFKEEGRCQDKGHLLMAGTVKLVKAPVQEMFVKAPQMIGVMPKRDASLRWTATAVAQDDVEMLTFSWYNYTKRLDKRLSREEQHKLIESMKQNAAAHFWH